mgnify:CR=1 FL=1
MPITIETREIDRQVYYIFPGELWVIDTDGKFNLIESEHPDEEVGNRVRKLKDSGKLAGVIGHARTSGEVLAIDQTTKRAQLIIPTSDGEQMVTIGSRDYLVRFSS